MVIKAIEMTYCRKPVYIPGDNLVGSIQNMSFLSHSRTQECSRTEGRMFVKDELKVGRVTHARALSDHGHELGLCFSFNQENHWKVFKVCLGGMINTHLKPIPSGGRVGRECIECSLHLKASGLVKEVLL